MNLLCFITLPDGPCEGVNYTLVVSPLTIIRLLERRDWKYLLPKKQCVYFRCLRHTGARGSINLC